MNPLGTTLAALALATLVGGPLDGTVRAGLFITEAMSSSNHPNGSANGDWWELTNTGPSAIPLAGYSWDDADAVPGASVFPDATIGPRETLLIVDEPNANLPGFRSAWALDSDVQLLGRDQFSGQIAFSGLNALGDEINLYNAADALVARAGLGNAGTGGRSFAWNTGGVFLGLSEPGENGAYVAAGNGAGGTGTDIGSPAVVVQGPPPPMLVITEVMSDSAHPGGNANGDWWELTNVGPSSVNLAGYSWDDSSGVPGTSRFPDVTIDNGESIVIVDEKSGNLSGFRSAWDLAEDARVLSRDEFSGSTDFSGLSAAGDAVNVYDPLGVLAANVEFGATDGDGRSFEWDTAGTFLGLSTVGVHGAYTAQNDGAGGTGIDVGSPTLSFSGGAPLLGDVNRDGEVNGLDVAPFVTLVTNATYQAEADTNEDGEVNGLDVDLFVTFVAGGGRAAAAVPEPAGLILAALGLLALVAGGRREW